MSRPLRFAWEMRTPRTKGGYYVTSKLPSVPHLSPSKRVQRRRVAVGEVRTGEQLDADSLALQEDVDVRIYNLRVQGVSIKNIAATAHMSRQSVHRAIEREGARRAEERRMERAHEVDYSLSRYDAVVQRCVTRIQQYANQMADPNVDERVKGKLRFVLTLEESRIIAANAKSDIVRGLVRQVGESTTDVHVTAETRMLALLDTLPDDVRAQVYEEAYRIEQARNNGGALP
jgi:exosome complex RNA-binding protein Rrp42 (RNase PH superfamily)